MKSVSFDLDGVLMQNPFGSYVGPRVVDHIHRSSRLAAVPAEQAHAQIRAAIRDAWRQRMRSASFVSAYDWDDIYAGVSRAFGGTPPGDIAGIVLEGCTPEHILLLPGAREGLEALRAAGYTLYALTNGYRKYQVPVLDALGILPLFEDVLTPEVLGYAKPDPNAFRAVPGLIAHVGDTLEHDVLGANLAGVASVWLTPDLPGDRPVTRTDFARAPLDAYLEAARARALYVEFHPEATPERLTPTYAVRDAYQAAQVLLD
ncbi:FMN phosphatase YigB (HAD superfamily) [Deinobacterium chartae]|uniref:FMN phosphatase YigB (HAD superfamily) n=1 Tax=Deinobacterium chartae TaxID=521158 RepID=A0A841HV48_9DEIO|nr:HAD family hydrolase [Deinobacterium chartae]MBB6096796.1 FMN phosphatase YigB (HAD superfamily) [Deinobacterium chartae]